MLSFGVTLVTLGIDGPAGLTQSLSNPEWSSEKILIDVLSSAF